MGPNTLYATSFILYMKNLEDLSRSAQIKWKHGNVWKQLALITQHAQKAINERRNERRKECERFYCVPVMVMSKVTLEMPTALDETLSVMTAGTTPPAANVAFC